MSGLTTGVVGAQAESVDVPQAHHLERALHALGLAVRIEPRDRLAIVHGDASLVARLADATLRSHVVREARAHGFTHVALELAP